jgi:hypothetical protein
LHVAFVFEVMVMTTSDAVLHILKTRLQELNEQYKKEPNELNRYLLVCREQFIRRWYPLTVLDASSREVGSDAGASTIGQIPAH